VFITCWSVKGGSGTTVVATALALLCAARVPDGALLVDLVGDAPLVLITCGGSFNPQIRHYRDNIVVYAVPIGT